MMVSLAKIMKREHYPGSFLNYETSGRKPLVRTNLKKRALSIESRGHTGERR